MGTSAACGTARPWCWALVAASGFECIRATPESEDHIAVFAPTRLIEDHRLHVARPDA